MARWMSVAHLLAHLLHRLAHEPLHGPAGFQLRDPEHEVGEHRPAVWRVHHFRVELDQVEWLAGMPGGGERAVAGVGDLQPTCW
jgi:hypothetical protein